MFTQIQGRVGIVDSQRVLDDRPSPKSLVDQATAQGVEVILVGLEERTIIDSMQIGLLFGIARQCLQKNMRLAIYGASPTVQQSLRWVNASRVMGVHQSLESALATESG